jgi:hypothetical protein
MRFCLAIRQIILLQCRIFSPFITNRIKQSPRQQRSEKLLGGNARHKKKEATANFSILLSQSSSFFLSITMFFSQTQPDKKLRKLCSMRTRKWKFRKASEEFIAPIFKPPDQESQEILTETLTFSNKKLQNYTKLSLHWKFLMNSCFFSSQPEIQ